MMHHFEQSEENQLDIKVTINANIPSLNYLSNTYMFTTSE